MISLGSLPDSLLSTIFASWLKLGDVAHVDSAYCSNAQRPSFLRTAYSKNVALQSQIPHLSSYRSEYSRAVNTWILLRSAGVQGLYLTDSVPHDPRMKIHLHTHGRLVSFLNVEQVQDFCVYKKLVLELMECCPNLVQISGDPAMTGEEWIRVANSCPLLEDIRSVKITAPAMEQLTTKCQYLKRVEFYWGVFINDELIRVLCEGAPQLEHLVNGYHHTAVSFADSSIAILTAHCRNLATLHVNATLMTDASIDALAEHCPRLHSLYLYDSHISGRAIADLSAACDLHHLGLHNMPLVLADDLNRILKNSPNLQRLELSEMSRTQFTISRCLRACPLLEELMIGGRIYEQSEFIMEDCPQNFKLRNLTVRHCTEHGLNDVLATLRHATYLTYLDISYETTRGDAAFVAHLVEHCRSLRVLKLRLSRGTTDDRILPAAGACPQLRSLVVETRKRLSVEMMCALRASCPRLRAPTSTIRASPTIVFTYTF